MDSRIIQTSYGKVHAKVAGVGPAAVFIHGRVLPLASWQSWKPNLEEVAEAGFRAIAIDLPGYGEAARAEGAISTESAVDCVLELFDRMPITRASIVGHNWGGLIAWRAALLGKSRVMKLVLVAAEGAEQLIKSLSGELDLPTLVVWAEDDPCLPVSQAQMFVDSIPKARKHVFAPGEGQPKLNHPEARQLAGKPFNDVVIEFLKE
ncbi:MAG TPA: alpha/beta fold hydrolase [Anaerolineales bacterium]|nr:alpha/beta fold hydrolase [Anaerolineales bacterium]